jgi:hypothetical protein
MKSFTWLNQEKGIFFINDIMKTNGNALMSVEELDLKYQITNTCMFYNSLLSCFPDPFIRTSLVLKYIFIRTSLVLKYTNSKFTSLIFLINIRR